ncbi:MAG: GntR family transcriptional regulator [Solirubrobacteraceae bacterium]|nr:GntR family transcriptional regulator [Solirubrobacteraceae bacterium]
MTQPAPDGDGARRAVSDPGLVDDLAERIHAQIRSGDFPIGTWLRQEALATAFGVSRTPVREALRKLQADRILEVYPHRGALVRGPTATDLRETYQIRGEIEGLAAELAATRITAEQLERLRAAETKLARGMDALRRFVEREGAGAVRSGPWDAADLEFRDAIVEAAAVERLRRLAGDLRDAFPRNLTWTALAEEPSLLDESFAQRTRIRAAIERQDPVAARRWMSDHLRRTGALVAEWFERQQPPDGPADPRDVRARISTRGGSRPGG